MALRLVRRRAIGVEANAARGLPAARSVSTGSPGAGLIAFSCAGSAFATSSSPGWSYASSSSSSSSSNSSCFCSDVDVACVGSFCCVFSRDCSCAAPPTSASSTGLIGSVSSAAGVSLPSVCTEDFPGASAEAAEPVLPDKPALSASAAPATFCAVSAVFAISSPLLA